MREQIKKIELTWTEFKTQIIDEDFPLNYRILYKENTAIGYEIYAMDETTVWYSNLYDTADKTEFEENYKALCNKYHVQNISIHSLADGLALVPRYRPKFYVSDSNIELNSSDTQLTSIDVDGQIDSIAVTFNRDDVEFILIVDGTEIFRETLENLSHNSKYYLHKDNNVFTVIVSNNGKQIIFNWNCPCDLTSNFTVKAKKTISGSTNMTSILIAYREKII